MAVSVQSFFDSARACQGFRSSDWFVALSDECGEGITSVWISLAHTHTDWSLSFSCAHYTHARRRHLFCGHHNLTFCASDNIVDNQIIFVEKIQLNLERKNLCTRVCYKKVSHRQVLVSFWNTHSRQLQRGHCSSLPPTSFFFSF